MLTLQQRRSNANQLTRKSGVVLICTVFIKGVYFPRVKRNSGAHSIPSKFSADCHRCSGRIFQDTGSILLLVYYDNVTRGPRNGVWDMGKRIMYTHSSYRKWDVNADTLEEFPALAWGGRLSVRHPPDCPSPKKALLALGRGEVQLEHEVVHCIGCL